MSCRYDKTLETYHESNATDAKRYDIIHGVDPLSATIFDRSISRTWPITSWSMEISTNNARLSWYPTMTCTITSTPDYWNGQDIQALFVPLTSRLWRYGNYAISLITVAGAHDMFNITTQLSTICATTCPYLYEGFETLQREISTSIYTGLTSYSDWLSISIDCYPPIVTTQLSTICATTCPYLYEGFETLQRDISVTQFTQTSAAGPWSSMTIDCYPPIITSAVSTVNCPQGYDGTMTLSASVSTTMFTHYSVTGSWVVSTSAACILHLDPETDPQPMGPVLMNNYNGTGGTLGQYGYYTEKDYDNLPTPLNNNVSAHWNTLSRYSCFIVNGLPYGYDFLNGIQVESIYLDNPTTEKNYLPPGYTWPPGTPTDHNCNRAYFEVWGCNSVTNQTITLYLCSARDIYGRLEDAPHQEISWLRLMKDGAVFYNDNPKDRITTIPWPTTTTTTPPP